MGKLIGIAMLAAIMFMPVALALSIFFPRLQGKGMWLPGALCLVLATLVVFDPFAVPPDPEASQRALEIERNHLITERVAEFDSCKRLSIELRGVAGRDELVRDCLATANAFSEIIAQQIADIDKRVTEIRNETKR